MVDAKVQAIRTANVRKAGEQDPNSRVNAGVEGKSAVIHDEPYPSGYQEVALEDLSTDDDYDEQWESMVLASKKLNEAAGIPGDFRTFSCTALENDLHCILEATPNWVHDWEEEPTLEHVDSDRKAPHEAVGLNVWWDEEHGTISNRLAPKLKQLMMQSDEPLEVSFMNALALMETEGVLADSLEASEYRKLWEKKQSCGKEVPSITWDVVNEVGDVWAQQFNIGTLNMLAIDYGDQILLGNAMQQALGEGNPSETNQCAIASVAAALEWYAQRWRKRIPSKNRVSILASTIREAEFAAAQQGLKEVVKATTVYEAEIETVLHDALNSNHARDLRTLGFFPF